MKKRFGGFVAAVAFLPSASSALEVPRNCGGCGMFGLARGYAQKGMGAYVRLQDEEFALEEHGYSATRHQREAGAGYFDAVMQTLGESSTLALEGSTEAAQFRS